MELRVNCYDIYFVPVDNVDTVLRNLFDHSLNSDSKTITSKYQCAENLAGTPASTETPRIMKKKNPAQLRRSKLRQEAFFRKKHEEAEASGNQNSADSMPNKAAGGAQQLLVQLESQQTENPVIFFSFQEARTSSPAYL